MISKINTTRNNMQTMENYIFASKSINIQAWSLPHHSYKPQDKVCLVLESTSKNKGKEVTVKK